MANSQRKQANLALTFKVVRFVNQLRRRVKPRALEGSTSTLFLGTDIHGRAGSSRISIRKAKRSRHLNRIRRSVHRNLRASSLSLEGPRPAAAVSASSSICGDELQHMLVSVDDRLGAAGCSFSSTASDNKLFLTHNSALTIEGYSLNATVELLVAVQDAINSLCDCRAQYGDAWLMKQGLEFGLQIDGLFIANYEHMLLRLRAELIEALKRKALEELLGGGHDKKQRKLLSWFTEFAEKPWPLSTSFPWTIKPSLAVLWGVCWMFYDNPPGEQAGSDSKGNNDRIRPARVLQHLQWNAPASSDYVNLGLELIGTQPALQQATQQQSANNTNTGLDDDVYQARNTAPWQSELGALVDLRLPRLEVGQAGVKGPPPTRAPAPPHPSYRGYDDTYYRPAQQQLSIASLDNFYSPHNHGTAAPLTAFPNLGADYHHSSWHPISLPQRGPRNLQNNTSPQTPVIRVTGTPDSDLFAQPQPNSASFAGIYQPGRQPEASPLELENSFYKYFPNTQYLDMAPEPTPNPGAMQILPTTVQIATKHERTSSINSNSNMPTPVSLSGPRSPLLSPIAREGPHLIASPRSHSRPVSEDRSSLSGEDDGSHRRNHSYKRPEDPPRNPDGKLICRHQDCTGVMFERKCEWSKHMDKHDRPYKCNVKGCEKLQGFTYSGGLLRHEREVHKMHGGTKKSLFCPFHDCKRSSGAGFTRKENLAEHVRRVHRRTSMSADMHGIVIQRETLEGSPTAGSRVASESPYSRTIDYREQDEMSLKRKRGSDSGLSDRGNDEMRAEIKRLRQENEEKDSRLRQLEQAVVALQQSRR